MTDQYRNFIGGEFVAGKSTNSNINPSDLSDVIGAYARADSAQVQDAISAAKQASAAWQYSSPQLRFEILERIGIELAARSKELGELLAREEGKTLAEGIGEVTRASQIFKFFAGEAVRTPGELVSSVRPGISVEVSREPLGVVGIIAPWNFPIAIPAWKIAPALCYGNAVVFKPAELVPGSSWALSEIISRSGMPEGVFNLVMGAGSVVGAAMVESADVAGITFTGSVGTGHGISAQCIARGAKVQTEMGGKNPLVVLDDADLDVALECAINGAFYSTGQRCTASSRLVVTAGIYDQFVEQMVARTGALRVGHALHPDTQIGPVIDEKQLQTDLSYISIGKEEGAELAVGGELAECEHKGHYLTPALFVDTDNSMRINQEEIFGPVASVIKADDYDAALAIANDVVFGLSAGICTTSLRYASDFKRKSQAGMVMVNLPTAGVDYHVPFGGRKASSYGSREQGRSAAEFYTTVKTSYVAP